ncbi:hypothetical protein MNV49_004578 [Pseudohyphozyma bogoriensis]|nr:hypothetical protein MNV49_004578 [Pseudohyphozyma bogoriensis]
MDEDDEREQGGIGTLILDEDGRARYLGHTAGAEYLREPDENSTVTPAIRPSKAPQVHEHPLQLSLLKLRSTVSPFSAVGGESRPSLEEAVANVPDREEARLLAECYFRHVSWNYDIIPRETFDHFVEEIYARRTESRVLDIHPHNLALFFAILALGCHFNLEVEPNDHVLGHFYLSVDGKGDSSWPIWGLCMRMIQAMGLHRDGEKWELPEATVNEHRRIFWECHSIDVCQSNNFSRPNAIQPEFYDTKFPSPECISGIGAPESFSTLKFKFAQISLSILRQSTMTKPTPYKQVQGLWKTLQDFEASVPFYMRCRPAWSAIASLGESSEAATMATPEIQRLNFKLSFQQHTLAMNICEAVLSLQRPFFTRALFQSPRDLTKSRFYPSVTAVFERCLALSAILVSMRDLYPIVTSRHWNGYYHTFTAAVCFSTLVILSPSSPLAPIALRELASIVDIFSSTPAGSRPRENLGSLIKMQQRAQERFSAQSPPSTTVLHQLTSALGIVDEFAEKEVTEEEEEHITMMGWDTRLVRRMRSKRGAHPAVSVRKGPRKVVASPTATTQSDTQLGLPIDWTNSSTEGHVSETDPLSRNCPQA